LDGSLGLQLLIFSCSLFPLLLLLVCGCETILQSIGLLILHRVLVRTYREEQIIRNLALECRIDRGDVIAALAALSDLGTVLATTAERAFSRALSGSCTTPLAAYAQWEEGRLWIRGYVARRDGSDALRGEREAEVADGDEAEALGLGLADEFLARGAARLVATA